MKWHVTAERMTEIQNKNMDRDSYSYGFGDSTANARQLAVFKF